MKGCFLFKLLCWTGGPIWVSIFDSVSEVLSMGWGTYRRILLVVKMFFKYCDTKKKIKYWDSKYCNTLQPKNTPNKITMFSDARPSFWKKNQKKNLGVPKKICKNFNFFLKTKFKKIWGYQKNLRKFHLKKNRKKSGVPKKSEKIPDFLKIREQGVPKIPETADHNV